MSGAVAGSSEPAEGEAPLPTPGSSANSFFQVVISPALRTLQSASLILAEWERSGAPVADEAAVAVRVDGTWQERGDWLCDTVRPAETLSETEDWSRLHDRVRSAVRAQTPEEVEASLAVVREQLPARVATLWTWLDQLHTDHPDDSAVTLVVAHHGILNSMFGVNLPNAGILKISGKDLPQWKTKTAQA